VHGTVRLETDNELELAHERLRRRDPQSLVAFLMSLATLSGPVGEQIRTFIVGDDLTETVESLKERIGGLAVPTEYAHRHSRGREMGASLDFIIDSVERLVLPVDANAAFELLAAIFEADAVAIENCGEHDWEVACAYTRAAGVMAMAARSLQPARVEVRIKTLIEGDRYAMRAQLVAVFAEDEKGRR
jgi:hypothetical protein